MATRKPVVIDGEFTEVSSSAKLSDVVGPEVSSVSTSAGQVIPRAEFARWPVPDGFERNLTEQRKG